MHFMVLWNRPYLSGNRNITISFNTVHIATRAHKTFDAWCATSELAAVVVIAVVRASDSILSGTRGRRRGFARCTADWSLKFLTVQSYWYRRTAVAARDVGVCVCVCAAVLLQSSGHDWPNQ